MRTSSVRRALSLSDQSFPLRVKSLMSEPSIRDSRRYPSNLISKIQSEWSPGGASTNVASWGENFSGRRADCALGRGAGLAVATRPGAAFLRAAGLETASTAAAISGAARLAAAFLAAARLGRAFDSPLTLSGNSSTTLNSDAGRTNSSFSLINSHGSCFSPRPFMRINAHLPLSLWPCSSNLRLPALRPAWGSPIGSQVPLSQTMTLPAPY